MPFDDDDTPTAAPAVAEGASTTTTSEEVPTAEEALEEAPQDFLQFASLLKKKAVSAQTIRKGEKDFESHGTKQQENALEQSRRAMEDVLGYTRVYTSGNWMRGWYFPDHFVGFPGEEDEGGDGDLGGDGEGEGERKRGTMARERVVVLDEDIGNLSKTLGRVVTGQGKGAVAKEKSWLLPEEALFLIERGNLDLWWPVRGLDVIFPSSEKKAKEERLDAKEGMGQGEEEEDEYELGIPLSLQAAYSLLIGEDGERGKISLRKFQVYSNLKRLGYKVLRAPALSSEAQGSTEKQPTSVWQWLFSLIPSSTPEHQPYGPLVRPGIYRSYKSIYTQLDLVPRHKPSPQPSSPWPTTDPFQIHFHVWKSSTTFSKTRPPPPDFYLSVVDAQDSAVPTLEEMASLLDSTPFSPPREEWKGPGRMYARIKNGYRNVILAVVDTGVVNYLRLAEAAFAEEELVPRFDWKNGPRGGKRGGKGGGRGRGGRGGRGGGRGNGR
ncbi:hypothetical protein GE09DRAFT_1234811 [Coniochaeta sp. 2T2.1]|nr:hypothetical protein GE09DRAFT_1234811 [Coniochaeta sp. 2T2.1]